MMLTSRCLSHLLPIEQVCDEEKCLRVATELFVTQGYSNTDLLDVANACQWDSEKLHVLFDSKQSLVFAALNWIIKDCRQHCFVPVLRQALEKDRQDPELLKTIERFFLLSPFCLLPLSLSVEPVFHTILKPYFAQWMGSFHALLPQRHKAVNWQQAQALISQLHGGLLTAKIAEDSLQHEQTIRNVMNQLSALM